MSINNSKREYLYSLFLKFHKDIIEELISEKVDDLILEKTYVTRKVDISCIDIRGRIVLIELGLRPSDYTHYKQVNELIQQYIEENISIIIIWGALTHNAEYIENILLKIIKHPNVEFFAVGINEEILPILDKINSAQSKHQIEMLDSLLKVKEQFKIYRSLRTNINYDTSQIVKIESLEYTEKQKILIRIIERLRTDCMEYPNVHQYKNVNSNCFILGSGYQDINFKVTIDRAWVLSIELVFCQSSTKKIFEYLYSNKEEINDKFDYILEWNTKFYKIYTNINRVSSKITDIDINRFCRIVKRYLNNFDDVLKTAISSQK